MRRALTFPLEHNNLSIYQPIFMKFCMQAYIHKISNEFENQIASIIFNGVIALFVLLSWATLWTQYLKYLSINFDETLYASLYP